MRTYRILVAVLAVVALLAAAGCAKDDKPATGADAMTLNVGQTSNSAEIGRASCRERVSTIV